MATGISANRLELLQIADAVAREKSIEKEIVIAAIEALGGKASDVVRTRIYVTDIAQWREAGEIHSEFFESIRPATTMVQVAKLIDEQALVEIEADALIRHENGQRSG